MKRRIVLTIDCNPKTCGECVEYLKHPEKWRPFDAVCCIYHKHLMWPKRRCPDCLRDEKEAKR
jgi:hypothetical protein